MKQRFYNKTRGPLNLCLRVSGSMIVPPKSEVVLEGSDAGSASVVHLRNLGHLVYLGPVEPVMSVQPALPVPVDMPVEAHAKVVDVGALIAGDTEAQSIQIAPDVHISENEGDTSLLGDESPKRKRNRS